MLVYSKKRLTGSAIQWNNHGDHKKVFPCNFEGCQHKDKKTPHGMIETDKNNFTHVFKGNWILKDIHGGTSVMTHKGIKFYFDLEEGE
jgi:hypothetical protein